MIAWTSSDDQAWRQTPSPTQLGSGTNGGSVLEVAGQRRNILGALITKQQAPVAK